MAGGCFVCGKAAERACTHCGRFFCADHGKVAVCGFCLSEQVRAWKVILALVVAGLALWGMYSLTR